MGATRDILVFPETKDSKKIFNSFISHGDIFIHYAEKDESGLKKFSEHDFDLIIIEVNKPFISEIEFIESINSLESDIPIVIVSDYFKETASAIFNDSSISCISKPLNYDKLSDTIKQALDETHVLKAIHEEQAQIKAEYENKKLLILYEISKNLHSITDIDKLLKTMIDYAKDTLGAERATVFIYDRTTNEIWSRIGTGINKREIRFNKSKGVAGKVLSTGQSIITDDPYNHPDFNPEFDQKSGFKTRNLLSVPMKNIKGRIVGVFQVLNKIDSEFCEEDEKFLEAISSHASITIENATLHYQKMKKIEEMHLLFDELKKQQKEIVVKTKNDLALKILKAIEETRDNKAIKNAINNAKKAVEDKTAPIEKIDKIGAVNDKMFELLEEYVSKFIVRK